MLEEQVVPYGGLEEKDFKEFEKQIEDYDKWIKLVKQQIFSTLASSKGVIERLKIIIKDDTDLGAQKAKEELISMFGLDETTNLFDNKQNISLDDSQFKQSFINEMFVMRHDMKDLEKTFRKMDVEARVARRDLYRIVNEKFKEVRGRINENDNNAEIEKSLYEKLDNIGKETRPCLIIPNEGSKKEPSLDVTPDQGSKKEPRLDVTPGNAIDILNAMSSAVRGEEQTLLSPAEWKRIETLIQGGSGKGEDVDTRKPKAVELKTVELMRKLDSRQSGGSSSQGSGSGSDITHVSDASSVSSRSSCSSYKSTHSKSPQDRDSSASLYTARSRESDSSDRSSSSQITTKASHGKGRAPGNNST